MLNVPATVGLMVLAAPIVALIFERGSFTPADTAATAAALQFYAIGLVGYSVVRIVSPTFYALGRSRMPVDGERRCRCVVNIGAEHRRWCACWAIAGWRSARRSRRIFNAGAAAVPAAAPARRHRGAAAGRSRCSRSLLARRGDGRRRLVTRTLLAAGHASRGRRSLLQIVARRRWPLASALVVLAGAAQVLRIREFARGARPGARPLPEDDALKSRLFGLHPAIWAVASTHFVVDAYGNMYAPLLPLLIPQLNLSLDDGRHAGDVLPAGELGVAARLRRARRSLATAACC